MFKGRCSDVMQSREIALRTFNFEYPERIRAHVRELVEKLGSPRGGFAPAVHAPSVGHGVTEEATLVAVDEFKKLAYFHHRKGSV